MPSTGEASAPVNTVITVPVTKTSANISGAETPRIEAISTLSIEARTRSPIDVRYDSSRKPVRTRGHHAGQDEPVGGVLHAEDGDRATHRGGHGPGGGGEQRVGELAEHDADSPGRQQRRHEPPGVQAGDHPPLEHDAEQRTEDDRDRQADTEREVPGRVHHVGTDHHQVALGQVDDAELPEDQTEAHRDQHQDREGGHEVQEQQDEIAHRSPPEEASTVAQPDRPLQRGVPSSGILSGLGRCRVEGGESSGFRVPSGPIPAVIAPTG
jgi:hypothetical protein